MGRVQKSLEYSNRAVSPDEISELMDIFEETYDMCLSKKEQYYRQIALFHLFAGIPYTNKDYCLANPKINYWILQLRPLVNEFRIKFHHGEV